MECEVSNLVGELRSPFMSLYLSFLQKGCGCLLKENMENLQGLLDAA